MAEHRLDPDHSLYQTFDNGMHAWVAYKVARTGHLPIPEWVLSYFDAAYARLREKGGTATPELIAKALELHTPKGGRSARERAVLQRKYLAIISAIREVRLKHAGKKPLMDDLVFAAVAERFGMSHTRVRNIYYEWTSRPVKARQRTRTLKRKS